MKKIETKKYLVFFKIWNPKTKKIDEPFCFEVERELYSTRNDWFEEKLIIGKEMLDLKSNIAFINDNFSKTELKKIKNTWGANKKIEQSVIDANPDVCACIKQFLKDQAINIKNKEILTFFVVQKYW